MPAKSPAKKAAPTHPKYNVMITAAMTALASKSGSSKSALSKYIVANYKVGESNDRLLKSALLFNNFARNCFPEKLLTFESGSHYHLARCSKF